MPQDFYSQDLLIQAGVAAELTNALASVSQFGHQSQTQTSIENAIISLLAPFQPKQTEKAEPAASSTETDNGASMPDPRLDPNWCEVCQQVHSEPDEEKGLPLPLLTLLALLASKRKKPE